MRRAAPSLATEAGTGRPLLTQLASGGRRRRAPRAHSVVTQAGFFGDLFDFEKWAPRSSQAWRLGVSPNELRRNSQGADAIKEEDVEVLNQRLAEARRAPGAALSAQAAAAAEAAEAEAAAAQQPNFLQSTDEEFASALSSRISQVASSMAPSAAAAGSKGGDTAGDGSVAAGGDDGTDGGVLTGPLLRELIFSKWGKSYDLSFVRRDLPLGKTLICVNVMWTHLEQRTFPMTEEEYDEKMELVSLYLNSWGQAERVEAFLRLPPRPRMGMPSKPIVGTAVSIQLDLEDRVVDEFFSQGGA